MDIGNARHMYAVLISLCGILFVLVSIEIFVQQTACNNDKDVISIKKFDILTYRPNSFSGGKIRDFTKLNENHVDDLKLITNDSNGNVSCKNWAVVTTIFKLSDAVRKMAQNPSWCLVIVADKKTPHRDEYLSELKLPANEIIVFLSTDDQDGTFPLLSKAIPWNHIGRKNIGYMYAIKHSAEKIWDFDDDNVDVVPTNITEMILSYKTPCARFSNYLLNPYPYFSVNETYTWPRGFPLQKIRSTSVVSELCTSSTSRTIGVVQSLANEQPDVDAIYRFTRDTPFNFGATPSTHLPLIIPLKSVTPFNAQATLWLKEAFRYIPLPVSVAGRVSDIWRSYIAQYFFHQHSLHVVFVPPYVNQHRNAHDNLQDFNNELDIYQKSFFLTEWLSEASDLNEFNLTGLYRQMYERGYLEEEDVYFIDAWTKTFDEIR